MSDSFGLVTRVQFGSYYYPVRHWKVLSRFAVGDERDPRGQFRLAADLWDAWMYAEYALPVLAKLYRYRFGRLRTFLKLYAKWYLYRRLLGRGELRSGDPALIYGLAAADDWIFERGYTSVDDISSQQIFSELWASLLTPACESNVGRLTAAAVHKQKYTRPFWLTLRTEFGVPAVIPPVAPYVKKRAAEFAADESKVIPGPVIEQLANKLALHRGGAELLVPFDHLRLCVILLHIALGRRITELLIAPRGEGSMGPLKRLPARGDKPEGALWFQFAPLKDGPDNLVYVSSEWEDLVLYCVREILRYGDMLRPYAGREECRLLILVSKLNFTRGVHARWLGAKYKCEEGGPDSLPVVSKEKVGRSSHRVTGLTYASFNSWLNGNVRSGSPEWKVKGVLERWGITADGLPDSPVYVLRTHYGRHSRHSALARSQKLPLIVTQRDLNHRDKDMQFNYRHLTREANDALLAKLRNGKLVGRGVEWLSQILETDGRQAVATTGFSVGKPMLLDARWRALIKNNPLFLQMNRVKCGYCVLPQGPSACMEYMNCTAAQAGGCHSFVVDAENKQMLRELEGTARDYRERQQESLRAGRIVQAEKLDVQARRTEGLRGEALSRVGAQLVAELKAAADKIEKEGL
jgi:hypothetical protein